MSLSETLIDKAAELVDDHSEEWADKLLKEGRELAKDDALGDDGKKAAGESLDLLEANKQPFLRLGKLGFTTLLAMWRDDEKAEARRRYLETQATYAERRAAMHAAGDAAADDRTARKAAWEAVEDTLKEIGTIGLKFLLKVALTSLGVPGLA